MNLQKFVLALFLAAGTLTTIAQTPVQEPVGSYLRLSAGMAMQNYQNLKAARHQLHGTGGSFGLGWGKETANAIRHLNLGMNRTFLESSLSPYVKVNSTAITIDLDYLHRIGAGKVQWYAGAGLNANFNLFQNDKLQNDQSTYNFLNTLMLKTAARRTYHLLGRKVQGEFSAALGLLAFGKDTKSFAFTAPQNFLEDGKFNYQGSTDEADNPFQSHELMTVGSYRRIQTGLKFRILPNQGKRNFWELGYLWDYYSYEDVKNYRVTSGTHSISLSYNFMFHRKK